ncbi:phospholipase [Actinokineospora iranica]|uniref:Phospholipase A2 n=1 Tax=Actinokineospora iranica TaxID=1271860 RepID=A0A1G6KI14_9PSEU|nr:phospholipase [Actinokineospora iranica]SDC30719.1 phospholipase A2 [Actinokineospora iranica]
MPTSTLRRVARGAVSSIAVTAALVAGAGSASADLSQSQLQTTTDNYLFTQSLSQFQTTRANRPYANQLDWSSDGCSSSPDNPFGFNFVRACHRHDFGYRNYKRQGRFTETTRLSIDNKFKSDLYTICAGNWACNRTADVYYAAVRQFGNS